jgi:hypothetical protein
MKALFVLYGFIIISLFGITAQGQSSEFSISGMSSNSRIGGVAFDGTNYLAGLSGDITSDSNLTLQFFTQTGQLVGNRIQLQETGSAPLVAFDGINYLIIWADRYVKLNDDGEQAGMTNYYGRFINPSGTFTGPKFPVALNAYIKGGTVNELHFNGSDYFFIYREENEFDTTATGPIFGRFISTSGQLSANPIRISSTPDADEISLGFDGTNYLAVFSYVSKYIFGQFISKSGLLIDSNFVIDGSENHSDNPVWVSYGGGQYMVAFHDDETLGLNPDPQWNIFARLVSTTGVVDSNRITICDYLQNPIAATIAFDGTNFLSSWHSLNSRQIKGRFLSTTGMDVGQEFTIFDSINNTMPLGGLYLHSGTNYLAVCTRISWPPKQSFISADKLAIALNNNAGIYGKFITDSLISVSTMALHDGMKVYPSPANDWIVAETNSGETNQILNIYNSQGSIVKTVKINHDCQRIDVSDLRGGLYIVEVKSTSKTSTKKIMVQR